MILKVSLTPSVDTSLELDPKLGLLFPKWVFFYKSIILVVKLQDFIYFCQNYFFLILYNRK